MQWWINRHLNGNVLNTSVGMWINCLESAQFRRKCYIKVKVIYFSFQLHIYTSKQITKIVRVFKRNGTWHEFRKILRAKMNNIFLFIMIIANVAHWKKPIRKAVSKNCHFFQCTEQLRIQNHPYNCVLNKKKLSARVPRHRHSQKWKWK